MESATRPSSNLLYPFRLCASLSWALRGGARPNSAASGSMKLDAHADAALRWILHAQTQSRDGGVPAFFNMMLHRWAPSYPETTGYLIPTLLQYGSLQRGASDLVNRAVEGMAEYLLRVQSENGAVPGWEGGSRVYVFDTGQVLQGYVSAWKASADKRYRDAGLRAGEWLIRCQDDDGAWRCHQFGGQAKAYDARIGWILIDAGFKLDQSHWVSAGRQALKWAAGLQKSDGWFPQCWLDSHGPALTHAIGYVVEGLLQGGALLEDASLVTAGRRAAEALLAFQDSRGHLCSDWEEGWQPVSRAACLTGDAQLACSWFRLYRMTGEARYLEAAQRAVAAVASVQFPAHSVPALAGGISGSWPVWGRYLNWRLPNWACKFFLDAVMLWRDLEGKGFLDRGVFDA